MPVSARAKRSTPNGEAPALATLPDAASAPAADRDEQQMTRAAWLYYVAGMTQAQIGRRLGLTRVRVNRILAQAREQGLVQVQINARLSSCVELEAALCTRFGLQEATVVPTPADQAAIPQTIAVAAAAALSARVGPGMSIGVGWGRTLRLSLQSVPRRALDRLSVVSLIGGVTAGSVMNTYETALHLAEIVGGRCFFIAAPAFADSAETRDILLAQPMLRDVFARARAVDLALISVGSLDRNATMLRLGLIGSQEARSLAAAGAVGDLLAHWTDAKGQVVDHPLNRRVIALRPEDLRDIPCVIVASGGRDKVGALHGALVAAYVDVLITDEETAQAILECGED